MRSFCLYAFTIVIGILTSHPVMSQTAGNRQAVQQSMEQNDALLDKFSRKCERRTKKAGRRFNRYEKKIQKFRNSMIPGFQDSMIPGFKRILFLANKKNLLIRNPEV